MDDQSFGVQLSCRQDIVHFLVVLVPGRPRPDRLVPRQSSSASRWCRRTSTRPHHRWTGGGGDVGLDEALPQVDGTFAKSCRSVGTIVKVRELPVCGSPYAIGISLMVLVFMEVVDVAGSREGGRRGTWQTPTSAAWKRTVRTNIHVTT